MSRKRRRSSLPKSEQFVQLINHFRAEPAWRALGCPARIAYIEIKSLYNGQNNGNLMASVRWLAEQAGISRGAAEKALRDLQEHGFIVAMRGGHLGAEGQGQGTLWRLTEIGYAGDRPTKDYQNWQPKNKSPSYKKGQGVPREGTVSAEGVPFEGTGCPIKRDSLAPKSGGACPTRRDNLQYATGARPTEAAPADPKTGCSAFEIRRRGVVTRIGVRTGLGWFEAMDNPFDERAWA